MPRVRLGRLNPSQLVLTVLAAVVVVRITINTFDREQMRGLMPFHSGEYEKDQYGVLQVDEAVMTNVLATLDGSYAVVQSVGDEDAAAGVKAISLSATVDRRPVTVRAQLKQNPEIDGSMLGCAISATTFVSDAKELDVGDDNRCHVCFKFSNHEDKDNFVPDAEYEELNGHNSATKCFGGSASIERLFVEHEEGAPGYGYPYIASCLLPSGVKALTCRAISRVQNEINYRDDVQSIYFHTQISLKTNEEDKKVLVHTEWPWTAVMSHDDDRSKIAEALPETWDDIKSKYVPSTPQEVILAHAEGPVYNQAGVLDKFREKFGQKDSSKPQLESMLVDESILDMSSGVLMRLLVNLFNFIRNAPNSTHMIAVVDSQLAKTYRRIEEMLQMKISALYPGYGNRIFSDVAQMKKWAQIPIDDMEKVIVTEVKDMTLLELLHVRGIKILMVPVVMPSDAFEYDIYDDRYSFTPYLAARYAADYNVMVYADGAAVMIEKRGTLQEILHRRFFSDESTRCHGHRFGYVEEHIQPDNEEYSEQCLHDLMTDENKWEFIMNNCKKDLGSIAARTDSVRAFGVHDTKTDRTNVPDGIADCVESDEYVLDHSEIVEVHLSKEYRQKDCACFKQPPAAVSGPVTNVK